jgi:hypothetical protein
VDCSDISTHNSHSSTKEGGTHLNSFSSSITCIPCSYCSLVGASPTPAKWPFIVMTEGAVGYLTAASGLFKSWPLVWEVIMTRPKTIRVPKKGYWLVTLVCGVVPLIDSLRMKYLNKSRVELSQWNVA